MAYKAPHIPLHLAHRTGIQIIGSWMMKKLFLALLALVCMTLPSCAQTNTASHTNNSMKGKKVLVVYYSRTGENYAVGNIAKGNTHIIAEMIADKTGGKLFEVAPVNPYPEDYMKCTEVAKKEKEEAARPAIKDDIPVEDYDVIFIGYPIWWDDAPMPLHTFIDRHNWQGKTVIPFCTHEGSGLGSTESIMAKACKGATLLKGHAIQGSVAQNQQSKAREDVDTWLSKIGF